MYDNIVIFTYLVENGSFSKTAELLKSSQATVSRKITELEQSIGKRLFIRDTRSIVLTQHGTMLYQKFKSLRDDLNEIMRDISTIECNDKQSTMITACLPNALSYELICPFIHQYAEKNPNNKLNLIFTYKNPVSENIKFDIALTRHEIKSEDFHSRFVRKETLQLYCQPAYVAKFGLPRSIDELQFHHVLGGIDPELLLPMGQLMVTNRYTGEKIPYNNFKYAQIKTNMPIHIKQMGMSSDFIFPCWSFLSDKEVAAGQLIPVLPEYIFYEESFYLVYSSDISFEASSFAEFLYQCAIRDPIYFAMSQMQTSSEPDQ